MYKATIIIPNYNGIKYMTDCLDSLYRLKEQELFRVLVVDNGSGDGSVEMIRQNYPQVKLIELSENTGFCHAVNVGIENSRSRYVVLLNNDTVVLPGFVEALVNAIEKDEKIFSVSSCMLHWVDHSLIDDAGDRYCVLGWAYARGKGRPADQYNVPVKVFAACGGASIYRKAVFDEIGLFDEQHFAYLEDIDVGYRAGIYGYRNYYTPEARVLHAGSATSGSRYNEFKTRLASANSVYLIFKNMPFLQILWNLPFLMVGFFVKACFFAGKKMGAVYLRGLLAGVKKSISPQGRVNRVRFQWKHFPNYLKIQGLLYLDTIRLLGKK